MRLTNIKLTNFRCYDDLEIDFHKSFNILLGINGTGKTAILEAIRIALGSVFSELDKIEGKIYSPNISLDDVRLHNGERQYEVRIETQVSLNEYLIEQGSINTISWTRTVKQYGGNTRYENAQDIKSTSKLIQNIIREKSPYTIPLIAYFSTERFKKEKVIQG